MARRMSAPVRIGANLAGLVIFALCAFPVYWMVNTSLLPRNEIRAPDPTWIPLGGTLENYRRALDGAGAWQRLRHVVLPTIRPVLLVVGLLQVIWDLRVFTQIYVLQKAGGVTRDTNLLGTYIYRLGIGGGDFGTAAAVAMFMLALTVLLTAPYVRTMLKNEED